MERYEWILAPTLIGAGVGLVLSHFNCHRLGSRLLGLVSPWVEGTTGGFLIGALVGLLLAVLSGPGAAGRRWLSGVGIGGFTGLLCGWLEDRSSGGPRWYVGLAVGALVGAGLRYAAFVIEHLPCF